MKEYFKSYISKRQYILAIIILLIIFVTQSCKSPTAPMQDNLSPGSRNYTWVADTINNPYLDFYNIWGSSPSNIWTTGALMSDGVYHYSGQKWSLDNRTYISDPDAVWGYGNTVWIGNDKGCIWKFTDSSYIEELKDFQIDGKFIDFVGMTGTSNNEIYAVGFNYTNPIIMKYDGNTWNIDKTLPDTAIFNQIIYCAVNGKYYLRCPLSDNSTRIYEYDKKELKIIYNSTPSNSQPGLANIGGFLYIATSGGKIYKYNNGNMEFIFEVNNTNFGGAIWGRSRNDILIRMQDGIAQYNGTDWQYLFKSSTPIMLAPNSAVFNKDVFVPAKLRTTGYPIIYHGILK